MNWTKKIDLHSIINQGNTEYGLDESQDYDAVPKALCKELATELKSADEFELNQCAYAIENDCETIGDLNDMLDQVFDICDVKKIWCGMPRF